MGAARARLLAAIRAEAATGGPAVRDMAVDLDARRKARQARRRRLLPAGAAIYCFNHMNWIDPFILMASLPTRPRLYFFGPKERDMRIGGRNRVMAWFGTTVPYKPDNEDLFDATRRVHAALVAQSVGAVLAAAWGHDYAPAACSDSRAGGS